MLKLMENGKPGGKIMEHQTKPHVLVLGTYHMGGRGNRDVYQFNTGNVKDDKKQQEIMECVDQIERFNPTKIAVEYDMVRQDLLYDSYTKFIRGEIELDDDEIHQLGFRIAKDLGHESIYAVDWNRPVGGVPAGFVYDYAEEVAPEIFKEMVDNGEEQHREGQKLLKESTMKEYLLHINNQAAKDHQHYIKYYARVAREDYYVGIDWLANYWYRRNLIIYTNITRLIESPNERILVIYGNGHKHLIEQFIKESDLFQLEKVEDYLG
jgi:hypothetical protein